MKDILQSISVNCRFMLEMLISCGIYIIPLEKRKRFAVRLAAGALLCLLLSAPLSLPVMDADIIGGLIRSTAIFVFEFVLASFFIYATCRLSLYEAFFCGSCAYATQHFAYSLGTIVRNYTEIPWITSCSPFFVYPVVLVVFYVAFARNLPEARQYNMEWKQAVSGVLLVAAIVFFLSAVSQQLERRYGVGATLDSHLYAMFCCAFLLWTQVTLQRQNRLKNEMEVNERLWIKQKEQYQLSHENIEIINRKCHDLKYQIAALRLMKNDNERNAHLNEIEQAVDIYDTSMKSGNEVLDTILTEKALYCDAHSINITCVADGRQMDFMDPADIYTILGNAIDNAIEHIETLEDTEKRLLSISVHTRSNLLLIQVENYCVHTIDLGRGLPPTTKSLASYHGFGLKSIQYTAEKYGGVLSLNQQDDTFILRVSIPIPAEKGRR